MWSTKRKHQRATIVVAAKAMKAASQKSRSRNKAVANAALMAKRAQRQSRKAATAKRAFAIASQGCGSSPDICTAALQAHGALVAAQGDAEASSDGAQKEAATKSAVATTAGHAASRAARDAAHVAKYAAKQQRALVKLQKQARSAELVKNTAIKASKQATAKVKEAIRQAVDAKKAFRAIDKKMNGKKGIVGLEHLTAVKETEMEATRAAGANALARAKSTLAKESAKSAALTDKADKATAAATAAKAAARSASNAATTASKEAARLAAAAATTAQPTTLLKDSIGMSEKTDHEDDSAAAAARESDPGH